MATAPLRVGTRRPDTRDAEERHGVGLIARWSSGRIQHDPATLSHRGRAVDLAISSLRQEARQRRRQRVWDLFRHMVAGLQLLAP